MSLSRLLSSVMELSRRYSKPYHGTKHLPADGYLRLSTYQYITTTWQRPWRRAVVSAHLPPLCACAEH